MSMYQGVLQQLRLCFTELFSYRTKSGAAV
jgi:hypothetical protein